MRVNHVKVRKVVIYVQKISFQIKFRITIMCVHVRVKMYYLLLWVKMNPDFNCLYMFSHFEKYFRFDIVFRFLLFMCSDNYL